MKNLIVYSTRKGTSEKLAKMLADKLPGETVLANVKESPSVKGYDNVILGGAVLAGEIKNGMRKFAESNLAGLKNCRIALFCCCLSVDADKIKEYFVKSFPPELIDQAVAMESFGGIYRPEKENFIMRTLFKLMKATAQENILEENIEKIARCFLSGG
ncbi:MAG: flavodoxin domain-containing protein [Candidatus Stygibacter australis]|nr:flavodoxin domain-containing protein [Candidatus Stygibacter australis]MDP8321696.1 flavodoxin domain-containing protein [Candidatus Stygibacter australis]